MIHIQGECNRCASTDLLTFTKLDIISDTVYRRTECEKCGYWEIEDHKRHLVNKGVNENQVKFIRQLKEKGLDMADIKLKDDDFIERRERIGMIVRMYEGSDSYEI